MVQDLLFAAVLYGHEDLAGHLLLLEDLLLCLVEVPFSVFRVIRFRKYVGWFDRFDADSVLFVQNVILGHVSGDGLEGDSICIPLE